MISLFHFSPLQSTEAKTAFCVLSKAGCLILGQTAKLPHGEAKIMKGKAYGLGILIVTNSPQNADQTFLCGYAETSRVLNSVL